MKAKAIRKVQKSIDGMVDLCEDCNPDDIIRTRASRILDSLRELESLIAGSKTKKGKLISS